MGDRFTESTSCPQRPLAVLPRAVILSNSQARSLRLPSLYQLASEGAST